MNGKHVVIVGGGVAGLVTAWRLIRDPEIAGIVPTAPGDSPLAGRLDAVRSGLRVTVIESRGRLGGNIRSERDGGFTVEWGPNGYLDNAPETPRLMRLLGIESRVVPARDAAARRFLYVRGRLRPLPLSPVAFLGSSVLTLGGRLRVLGEPFVPARPDPAESVFSFAARRIGPEAARTLVDAMVSGVYGGDSRALSLVSAFPKMHDMEREHGGLVKAMLAIARERRRERKAGLARKGGGPAGPGGVLTSFDRGMEVLIESLEQALLEGGRCEILRASPAVHLIPEAGPEPDASGSRGAAGGGRNRKAAAWTVTLEDGRPALHADAVVLAVPSRHAGALVHGFDPELCTILQSIPEAPMVVIGLAFRESDLPGPLDGFGFLVPRGEGPRSLGVLWDSSIYPGRAPEGSALLRVMIGGAQDPEAIGLPDDAVLAQARSDLARTMGLTAEPSRVWILRHPHGIPQYTLGHPERLRAVERHRAAWPGLFLTGNSYRGISVNHCVEISIPLAREILHLLDE